MAGTLTDLLGDGRLLKENSRVLASPGTSHQPQKGDVVSIHYSCRLASGGDEDSVLDSSKLRGEPFEFTLGESDVIVGLEHAVASMQCGEQATFVMSADLALGIAGCGGGAVPRAQAPTETPREDGGVADSVAVGVLSSPGALRIEVELLGVRTTGRGEVLENLDDLSPEERLQRAMKAKDVGNAHFKAGESMCAAAEYAAALQLLGLSKEEKGEAEAAEEDPASDGHWADTARKAARDKLATSCFLNLAQCELQLKDFLAAQQYASSALNLDPGNTKAIYRRGLANLGIGLLDRAKDDLLEAAKREPRNADIRAQLQECQRKMQASERHDKNSYGGMFGKVSLYSGQDK